MIKAFVFIGLIALAGWPHAATAQRGNSDAAGSWYTKGEQLFSLASPTDSSDAQAMICFQKSIAILRKSAKHANDLVLFNAYLRSGNLYDVSGHTEPARDAYLAALHFRQSGAYIADSMLFTLEVCLAASYYHLNQPDSTSLLLIAAEGIAERYPGMPGKERMYNALGALYFEKGNYYQSKNYFSKALQTIRGKGSSYEVMELNFETNIASSLYKLDNHREALALFRKIMRSPRCPNSTWFNAGKVEAALGNYAAALADYRRVKASENPGVLNELGWVHLQLKHYDSAAFWLDRFQWYNQGAKLNLLDNGVNKMYRAEWYTKQHRYRESLQLLQQAVIRFSGNFTNTDMYTNPADCKGTLNPYNLFNALEQKANTCMVLYKAYNTDGYLRLSLDTWLSALTVLQYIERSYDTDDSKLFLKKRRQDVYDKALSIALSLHRKYPAAGYLQQAFLVTEKNKASLVAASLREKAMGDLPPADQQLMEQEHAIKAKLAKLKLANAGSAASAAATVRDILDGELQLSRLQKKLEQNSVYYNLKYDDHFPGVKEIQQTLRGPQAIVSFRVAGDTLHAFVITKSSFSYLPLYSFTILQRRIETWLRALNSKNTGRTFSDGTTAGFIYQQLLQPLQPLLGTKDEWIIVPDGILCYLPFESLPTGQPGQYLVEKVAISYQFSSAFLVGKNLHGRQDAGNNLLALAPFNDTERKNQQDSLSVLPESVQEISGLPGDKLNGAAASKTAFLEHFSDYAIVHLATHAVSDRRNSAKSYIAFYDNRLYLEELYTMNMDNTRLVIISACESGGGEWASNEGVISIARGFTYAGCASTINSLWKADDKSTAFILSAFHQHLQQGDSKSKALQKAKISYLHSNAIYKTPNFWAHLVLTGDDQPLYHPYRKWMYAGSMLAICCGVFLLIRKKRQHQEAIGKYMQPQSNNRVSIRLAAFTHNTLFFIAAIKRGGFK